MSLGKYQKCIIVNNKNDKNLCGVKNFSETLVDINSKFNNYIFLLDLNLPKNVFDFKRFLKCIKKISKFSKTSQDTLFIFNLPTTPNYFSIFYILIIIYLSYKNDLGLIYHGYFHKNPIHSGSAFLLFLSKIKYRYYVTPGFIEKIYPLYSFFYKKLKITYLPVIPDYPREHVKYLNSPEKGFNQIPPVFKDKDLNGNYIYYFGIINPQKNLIRAIKLSQFFQLPLLFARPQDKFFEEKILEFIANSDFLYKPIIIPPPNLKDAYKLMEYSAFVINIPFSGVGNWSSSWLSSRLLGKVVLASHPYKTGYDDLTHSYFIKKENYFYAELFNSPEKINNIKSKLLVLSSRRKCTFNLAQNKDNLRRIFLDSVK